MKTLLASAAALALLTAPALAQNAATTANPEHLTQQDETFARDAATGNLAEIDAGRAAEQHGGSAATREFGHWLVADHTLAEQLLELSVRYTDIKLPTEPDQMQQQMLHRLSGLRGRQFDRSFAAEMVRDHETAVSAYQREQQDGRGRMKGYAMLMLPGLQAHLAEAQELQGGRGGMASGEHAPGAAMQGTGTGSPAAVGGAPPAQ